jgi:hypothetical protein
MSMLFLQRAQWQIIVGTIAVFFLLCAATTRSQTNGYDFNDSRFHLTNNVQEGPSVRDFLDMMGNRVGRATLFDVPLQQEWLSGVDGDRAPTYGRFGDRPWKAVHQCHGVVSLLTSLPNLVSVDL